jgi:hypothetical protein
MKQIYFTICEDGRSFSGRSGYEVRAVSADIYNSSQLMGYALYANPDEKLRCQGIAEDRFTESAPVSLRYCVAKSGSPIVVHAVYAVGKRPENFFSHMLIDLPQVFSPANAIALWKNPRWQKHDDPSISSPLPDVDWNDPDVTAVINEKTFGDFLLREHKNEDLFRFLLHAWLHRTLDRKIVLAADPEQIVFALWGMCRCLPKSMWKNMSFSTYEEASPASVYTYDITGLWNPDLSEKEVPILKEMRLGRSNVELWEPSLKSGATVGTQAREWEQQLMSLCLKGNFEEIDAFWTEIPAGFGESLEQLDIYLLATNRPSELTESQLAEGLKNPGIRDIIERSLKSDGELCKTIAEEWCAGNSDTSRLNLLLDGLKEESLLDSLVLSHIHPDRMGFIKKVLLQSPSPKFENKFLTKIWEILEPETLERENLKFFRPYALSWFKKCDNQRGIKTWNAIHSIEELSEALPQQDTHDAVVMCCYFCLSKEDKCDHEKTLRLVNFLIASRPRLAAKMAMHICELNGWTQVLETCLYGVFQSKDSTDHFVGILVPQIKSKSPTNYAYCLDKIVQSQTLTSGTQLLFSEFFSEQQGDTLAENWIKNKGIKNIRQDDRMRTFILEQLSKGMERPGFLARLFANK